MSLITITDEDMDVVENLYMTVKNNLVQGEIDEHMSGSPENPCCASCGELYTRMLATKEFLSQFDRLRPRLVG